MHIYSHKEIEQNHSKVIDPALWTVVVPAAGKGTRLGYSKPKILYPILGKPILYHLIDLLENQASKFVFALSPAGVPIVVPELQRRIPGKFETVVLESRGMADSIYEALKRVTTPQVLIIWGDQVAISPETLQSVMKLHQSFPDSKLTLPLLDQENYPYVHYAADKDGNLVSVLERREGAMMPEKGVNDCGVFACDTKRLQEIYASELKKGITLSKTTQEWNFLPLLPSFETGGNSVNGYRLDFFEEAMGVNDQKDAAFLEEYLRKKGVGPSTGIQNSKLKIAMFSGGRGTGAITEALLRYSDIELTLLVNTYDDGLSTGLLRRFIPGMLGPSDVRKNVSRFLAQRNDPASQALLSLIEYRFPDPFDAAEALDLIVSFTHFENTKHTDHELLKKREELSLSQMRKASHYLDSFLQYYRERIHTFPLFPFGDVSLGNLLFAGCYLANGQDFNRAVTDFSSFAGTGERVLNLTNGENRVLVAMKEDGQYLHDEASVVGPQDAARIQEIFLLPDYLDQSKHRFGEYKIDNIRMLRNVEQLPTLSQAAERTIREADIIIYGPGTQYSSLFPSYLTSGVAEAIQANTKAEKVFIGNIARDFDIMGEDATTLVKAFLWYMGRKIEGAFPAQDLVTRFFFQKPPADASGEVPYIPFDANAFDQPLDKVVWIDLEGEKGKHLGSKTVSELLQVIEGALEKKVAHVTQKVSIIIPALNEERTIKRVLRDLRNLSFAQWKLDKEIIVVDGGSTDETYAIAQNEENIKAYQVTGKPGRGKAYRLGIERAKGDIIVFFPSDGEYTVEDIKRIVAPLVSQEFSAVYGSRAFRTQDLSGTLQRIYGNKGFLYFVSKYGGISLSILTLLLYQRFISDPFTSIKGFNARVFRGLHFVRQGVDFDMELLIKLIKTEHVILEVPVNYEARTLQEGKKITVLDGIQSLLTLFQFVFWKPKVNRGESTHRTQSLEVSKVKP